MHHGAGIAPAIPPGVDRLALALDAGHLVLPAEGTILVLGAEPSPLYGMAPPRGRFLCEQGFRPLHDRLAAEGLWVVPDLDQVEVAPAAMALVRLPRQRAEALGRVARALGRVAPGGVVALDGAKAEGVDGLLRLVFAALPEAGRFAKAHGKLGWVERPARLPAAVADWAAADALGPNAEGFLTRPGMFSPERADPGSARLAGFFRGRLAGRVADLGAGWGWLAARALAEAPEIAALDLHEAEARAVEAARANLRDARAAVHWSDVARLGRPAEPYDWAIANPPFHRGRAAEPGLGAEFIAAAARILKPGGRLLMVANRQLPYEAALDRHFRARRALHEDADYKVIEAEGPRPAAAGMVRGARAGT